MSLNTADNYTLLSRVSNKPYDVFGCWLNETHLISGNLHWIGNMTSCSVLWLNKAFQVRPGAAAKASLVKPVTNTFGGEQKQRHTQGLFSPPFTFSHTGCWIGERQRSQAPFQDPERQRQHHSHGDGGPLPSSRHPGFAAGLRGPIPGSKAERAAAAAAAPAPPLWSGNFRQWGRRWGRGEGRGSKASQGSLC